MTDVYIQLALTRLSSARRWLELIRADEPLTGIDLTLMEFTEAYIRDLVYSMGQADDYGADDLVRLETIKDAVRSTDAIYDRMGELADASQKLPSEAEALLRFLSSAITELAGTINAIERKYPRLKDAFELDRQIYASSKLAYS